MQANKSKWYVISGLVLLTLSTFSTNLMANTTDAHKGGLTSLRTQETEVDFASRSRYQNFHATMGKTHGKAMGSRFEELYETSVMPMQNRLQACANGSGANKFLSKDMRLFQDIHVDSFNTDLKEKKAAAKTDETVRQRLAIFLSGWDQTIAKLREKFNDSWNVKQIDALEKNWINPQKAAYLKYLNVKDVKDVAIDEKKVAEDEISVTLKDQIENVLDKATLLSEKEGAKLCWTAEKAAITEEPVAPIAKKTLPAAPAAGTKENGDERKITKGPLDGQDKGDKGNPFTAAAGAGGPKGTYPGGTVGDVGAKKDAEDEKALEGIQKKLAELQAARDKEKDDELRRQLLADANKDDLAKILPFLTAKNQDPAPQNQPVVPPSPSGNQPQVQPQKNEPPQANNEPPPGPEQKGIDPNLLGQPSNYQPQPYNPNDNNWARDMAMLNAMRSNQPAAAAPVESVASQFAKVQMELAKADAQARMAAQQNMMSRTTNGMNGRTARRSSRVSARRGGVQVAGGAVSRNRLGVGPIRAGRGPLPISLQ